MSEELNCLVLALISGALMAFFFGMARNYGKPVPRNHRVIDQGEGPFVGPWGILESRKRDPDLEWDEIAIIDDLHRQDDEEHDEDEDEDEGDWLSQPGDDTGSGWTNFDYIAAEEMEDYWDGDE